MKGDFYTLTLKACPQNTRLNLFKKKRVTDPISLLNDVYEYKFIHVFL